MKKIVWLILSVVLMFSCVSKKKYMQLQDSEQRYYNAAKECNEEVEALRQTASRLGKEKLDLENRINNLVGDSIKLASELGTLGLEYDNLNDEYKSIKNRLNNLKDEEEVKKLLQDIQSLRNRLFAKEDSLSNVLSQLSDKEKQLLSKNNDLAEQQRLLAEQNDRLAEQNAQIVELNRILSEKDNALKQLKEKVSAALSGFEGNGLTVTNKNGKIYVSLDEKLLFQSGKWNVDDKGKSALQKLAEVLAEHKDVQINVEGHTDDVAYNGSGNILDNWDLSTKRATSVVRILLQNKNIEPRRISASGRGEFEPIDNSKTAEARQKNRRIEIILSPNLDEIMQILNN